MDGATSDALRGSAIAASMRAGYTCLNSKAGHCGALRGDRPGGGGWRARLGNRPSSGEDYSEKRVDSVTCRPNPRRVKRVGGGAGVKNVHLPQQDSPPPYPLHNTGEVEASSRGYQWRGVFLIVFRPIKGRGTGWTTANVLHTFNGDRGAKRKASLLGGRANETRGHVWYSNSVIIAPPDNNGEFQEKTKGAAIERRHKTRKTQREKHLV